MNFRYSNASSFFQDGEFFLRLDFHENGALVLSDDDWARMHSDIVQLRNNRAAEELTKLQTEVTVLEGEIARKRNRINELQSL